MPTVFYLAYRLFFVGAKWRQGGAVKMIHLETFNTLWKGGNKGTAQSVRFYQNFRIGRRRVAPRAATGLLSKMRRRY